MTTTNSIEDEIQIKRGPISKKGSENGVNFSKSLFKLRFCLLKCKRDLLVFFFKLCNLITTHGQKNVIPKRRHTIEFHYFRPNYRFRLLKTFAITMCEVLFSRPFVKQVKITAKSEKSFGNHFSTFIVHFANVHMYILPKLLR